jgi:hypothetical protein
MFVDSVVLNEEQRLELSRIAQSDPCLPDMSSAQG